MSIQIVVPDEFANFADKPSLMRYSVLLDALRRGRVSTLQGRHFIAGQGLDEMQIDHAYCLALSEGLEHEFQDWRLWRSELADRASSHKHRAENVLISTPERLEQDLFVSELRLHARSELMLDHLTGEHVQGMVLAEACRQMFLAVTELYYLGDFSAPKRYFVIDEMTIRYMAFAFPLPTQIRYRTLSFSQPRPDRVNLQADMEVWQAGRPVTGMGVKFSVFDAQALGVRESQLANKAVEHTLAQLREQFGDRLAALPAQQPAWRQPLPLAA